MKRIQIETAANGYIASEAAPRDTGCTVTCYDQHVFETFDSLSKWLSHQLEKPKAATNMADPAKSKKP